MTISPTSVSTPAPVLPAGPPRELLQSSTFLLKRLGWMITDRFHDALKPTGLTGQHYAVLSLLDEGMRETQGEIAERLGITRPQVSRLLKRAAPRLKVLGHSEIPETHSIRIGTLIGGHA